MTRRATPLARQSAAPATTADLFGGLHVHTPEGDLPAARIDIGWSAWRTALAATAGRWQRWRFWFALWRHFGKARYLVQVDSQYRIATSLRICKRVGGPGMEVLLLQSATPWQGLWQRLHRSGGGGQRISLQGSRVVVSRHPAGLAAAVLPPASAATATADCPEAVLDGERRCSLPLDIRDH